MQQNLAIQVTLCEQQLPSRAEHWHYTTTTAMDRSRIIKLPLSPYYLERPSIN